MHVPLTPVRALYRAVDLYGRKTGVVSGEQRFTYGEFGERVERLAFSLLSEGVVPGDRVAFLSFNTHQLLEGYFAAPLVRAIVMPLNVRLSAAELTCILNHATPRIVFYEADFAGVVDQLRQTCPAVQAWLEIGAAYEQLLARGRIQRPDIFTFNEQEIAELFYTSGSTGKPKGVMLSHRTLYMHMLGVSATFYNDESMVELHTIPLFHANGWGRPQCATLHGLKQVMVRRFEPAQVLRLIEEEGATCMSVVPTMANALLNCPDTDKYNLSSLRQIHIGGAASSPELVARLEAMFHCAVMTGYGLTESSPVATSSRDKSTITFAGDEERIRHRAMAGWPLPGCEVRVVDLQMKDVPRDMEAVGEIVLRGDNIMDGYYKEPQATAAVMTNGWLHTGDMAVWDAEGRVQIVDRKKDIIISGGENISSIEVERAIAAHEAVLECAVVSAPDEQWGEVPAAFIVFKPGRALEQQVLCEFLQQRLAKFKIPRRFHFSETPLPKTGTGKIIKRQLRETLWSEKELRIQG
ncbi:MAG: long-chain-fatty-acid--CoA ligase [Candidatus Solibacter sp.]